MSTLLLLPPDLRQRPNVNASAADVRAASGVVSAVSVLSDTFRSGRIPVQLEAAVQSAAGRTGSRSDIFCVGVSVGVHVHASLFVCLHLFVCPHMRSLSKSL